MIQAVWVPPFYLQAIATWRDNSGYGRVQLVKSYFTSVEGFTEPDVVTEVAPASPQPTTPWAKALKMVEMFMQRSQQDPFYAVIAYRNYKKIAE